MSLNDKRCKHCGSLVMKINFILGPRWMHVNPNVSFPMTTNNGLWEFCHITVAEPEDK